jgi:hypothetical protein
MTPYFLGGSGFIGNFDDIVDNWLDIHHVGDGKTASRFDMAKLAGDQILADQIIDGVLNLVFGKTEDVRIFLVGFLEFVGLKFLLDTNHIAGMLVPGHYRRVPIDDVRQKDDGDNIRFTGCGQYVTKPANWRDVAGQPAVQHLITNRIDFGVAFVHGNFLQLDINADINCP